MDCACAPVNAESARPRPTKERFISPYGRRVGSLMTSVTFAVFVVGLSPPVPDEGSRAGCDPGTPAPLVAVAATDGLRSCAVDAATPPMPVVVVDEPLATAPSVVPRRPDSTVAALTWLPEAML